MSDVTNIYVAVLEYFTGTTLNNVESLLVEYLHYEKFSIDLNIIFNFKKYKSVDDEKIIKLFELFFNYNVIVDYINFGNISTFIIMNKHHNILKFIDMIRRTQNDMMMTSKYKFYERCLRSLFCDQVLTKKILNYLFNCNNSDCIYCEELLCLFIEKYDDADVIELFIKIINKYYENLDPEQTNIFCQIFKSNYDHSYRMLQLLLEKHHTNNYEILKSTVHIIFNMFVADNNLNIKKIKLFIDYLFNNNRMISDHDIIGILRIKYLRNKSEKTFDTLLNLKFYPKKLDALCETFNTIDEKLKPYILDAINKNDQIDILNEQIDKLTIRNNFLYEELELEPASYEMDTDDFETLTEYQNVLSDQNKLLEETLLCTPGSNYYQSALKNFEELSKIN